MAVYKSKLKFLNSEDKNSPNKPKHNYYKNETAIKNLVAYIFRENKGGIRYGNTLNLGFGDASTLADQIIRVQKYFEKNKDRRMYHFELSYEEKPTPENAKHLFSVAEKIVQTFFKDTQICYAIHEDTQHIHVHFAFSAVTINGKKWNMRNKEFRIFMHQIQELADYLMGQHFLSSTSIPCIAHPVSGNQIMKPANIEDLI